MPVTPPDSVQSRAQEHAGEPTNLMRHRSPELKPEDFMKIFIAQLKHQNPTSPMDSSTMLQQMANIGQLNMAERTNKTMIEMQDTVKSTLAQTQMVGATQIMGKKVIIDSKKNISPMIAKEGISGAVGLREPASNVKVTIKDPAGRELKELNLGPSTSGGLMDFHWDGIVDGKEVPEDFYKITAKATINGKEQDLKVAGAFKVKSVALDHMNNLLILNVDGMGGQTMDDIIKIIN